MDKLFGHWKESMKGYYKNSHKGVIKSAWHHYKSKNIENELKEANLEFYKENYMPQLENLKESMHEPYNKMK